MAAGYNLIEGTYEDREVSDDELWSVFSSLFSTKSHNNTSYKFGFLKAILDNLYNVDEDLGLTFDQLFSKFAEIYWNLILDYRLKQRADGRSKIEIILKSKQEEYSLIKVVPFDSLSPERQSIISELVKKECKRYVIGALFEDTKRLFYSFSKADEWLRINPRMYDFICKHKLIIDKLNYYEWARFLEKENQANRGENDNPTDHILSKIDESSGRKDLSSYRDILYNTIESHQCFYCGKRLELTEVEMDHFVPWSFIKEDNLWNLVPACPKCNKSKRDKLPKERYLDLLIGRNNRLLECHCSDDLANYRHRVLRYVYEFAKINGYDIWEPKGIRL